MIVSINQLTSFIAKKEGLKKQVTIGNVREIVAIISDLMFLNPAHIATALYVAGEKRATKQKRKVKRATR